MNAYAPQTALAQPTIITLLDDSEVDAVNGAMSQADKDFYLGVAIGIVIVFL